jgi:hypothetical protein
VPTAQQLIERIADCPQLPPGRRRREIQRELRSHVEEFVQSQRTAGREPQEIERLLQARFGDVEQIARGFAWVYRHERRRLRLLIFALSSLLLASALVAMVLVTQAGLALGAGRSVTAVVASAHTVIEVLDILAAVCVYLGLSALEHRFERRGFAKAALLLGLAVAVAVLLREAAGWHIRVPLVGFASGAFFRAVQLFVAPRLARVGIVLLCFPLVGLLWLPLGSSASLGAVLATYSSWVVLGTGYLLMPQLAARLDAALLHGLERIQADHG